MMRIAIVNDLGLAVEVLRRLVRSVPGYEVAWTAADGVEAVEKCARDCPDLILMDLIMPLMDGAQATRIIMKQSPCAILVVTATVSGNVDKVFAALSAGALDAVATPVFGASGGIDGGEELLRKIEVMGKLIAFAGRETPNGNKISISDDEGAIVVTDESNNSITMDAGGITIESAGDISIKASGDVNIEGTNTNVKASAQYKAEGSAGVEMSSSATAVVKGSLVQIN